jgi:putative restriction endonuclease
MAELAARGEVARHGDGLYEIHVLSYEHGPPSSDLDTDESDPPYHATKYQTTVGARSPPESFRRVALARYDGRCLVSGVDQPSLLDVAHVLPWRDYPDHRVDPENVLVLDRTHHAAFDRDLFSIDSSLTLRTNPALETESAILRETLVERDGSTLSLPPCASVDRSHLTARNADLAWLSG